MTRQVAFGLLLGFGVAMLVLRALTSTPPAPLPATAHPTVATELVPANLEPRQQQLLPAPVEKQTSPAQTQHPLPLQQMAAPH